MKRNILFAILIVIILIIVGFFIFSTFGGDKQTETAITFLNNDTLKNGDQIEVELKDKDENILAGENVTISYQENGATQTYSLITDTNGRVYLVLSNEPLGEHNISATYNGNEIYSGCSASMTITIEEEDLNETAHATEDTAIASTVAYNNASTEVKTASPTYYDAQLNLYYDEYGKIIGGPSDGESINYIRSNPPVLIDENSSLVNETLE